MEFCTYSTVKYWIRFHLFCGQSYRSDIHFEELQTAICYANVEMELAAGSIIKDPDSNLDLLIVSYELIEEILISSQ